MANMPELEKLKARRAELVDHLDAINAKAVTEEGEARDLTEDEKKDWDRINEELAALDRQIERVKFIHQQRSQTARPLPEDENLPRGPPSGRATGGEQKYDPGIMVARSLRIMAAAKGDIFRAQRIAEKWGDEMIARALGSGEGPEGGFLVPGQYYDELIELLRPMSVVRAAGAIVMPMAGSLIMPKQTGGSAAEYVGENRDINASEPSFAQLTLRERKLAALVPVSNDLIRTSSPRADQVVLNDLLRAIAQREDKGFLLDDGTGNKPRGIRKWAPTAHVFNANATVNIGNITADLGRAEGMLANANVMMINPAWVMHPKVHIFLKNLRDANTSAYAFPELRLPEPELQGYPVYTSTQISIAANGNTDVMLVDFNDVLIGDAETLEIATSTEASYLVNGQLVSAFSQDQTLMRGIERHDIGMRYDEAVAVIQNAKWGTT